MPNHVTNMIRFYGEQNDINTVLEIIKGDDTCIDFEKIVPMPDNIFCGNLGNKERELYGENNWYDWSIHNWGTKWNAYSDYFDEDENTMTFDTAWSCPIPVLDALARLCYDHNVSFDGKWADEDCGNNVGEFDGNCCSGDKYNFSCNYIESDSHEAYEIYVELKGESCSLSKDENGNWYAHGCDDCPHPCC